ncbi:MAG: hypothetical protein IKC37_01375, partial [Clostridia bacterium]|nr:hypothetical protein [Clostridia bacterium]
LDEDELKEIPPVYFHGWEYEGKPAPTWSKIGKDGRSRASKYSATWLFFSNTQVYMYSIVFDMASDSKTEKTEEYFYKDITNFSTSSDSIEVTAFEGCMNRPVKKQIEVTRFALIVPGDKFWCSTSNVANVDDAIKAMKQKLREKKQ